MAHGTRVYEPPKSVQLKWEKKSESHSKILDWILECSKDEKELAFRNKRNAEEFHKQLQR